MMMNKAFLKTSAMVMLLSGCSLAPEDLRPQLPVVDMWPVAQQAPANQPNLAQVPWQDFFTNPDLQVLIQTALDNNRDLRIALLNVQVAQATYRVSEAALLPSVDGKAGDTIQRTPKELSFAVPQKPGVMTGPNYGYFNFVEAKVVKWNCVFNISGQQKVKTGD